MARPGLDKHRKFRRLLRLLGEPRPHVRGYLESLWEVAYENGDPVIGDPNMVEAAAEYPGESGRLFAALRDCGGDGSTGFIEETSAGIWQVHDLFDHAPEYVKKRFKRESERKSKNIGQRGGQRRTVADNGVPPAPAPAPKEFSKENSPHKPPKGAFPKAFEAWWSTYPKKVGKQAALRAWIKAGKRIRDAESITGIQAVERMQTACAAFAASPKGRGDYCPNPSTWLSQGRYDDDAETWKDSDKPKRPGVDIGSMDLSGDS